MHTPRKRFGQHFLQDQNVIQRIVAAIDPNQKDHFIEIGPGQGAITLPVLKRSKNLEAVELDRELIPALMERCEHAGHLQVHSADVLEFNFAAAKNDDRLLRLFGNLPYNISTPLIFHLIDFTDLISDMVFMVQKEVAERLAAKSGSKDFGRLSVMVQYHWQVDLLFIVHADAFYPPPKVESAIIRMVPHTNPPARANNYTVFSDIVKHAFGQRRKTLRNSLKGIVSDEVWESLPIKSDLRAENLTVDDFVLISNSLG